MRADEGLIIGVDQTCSLEPRVMQLLVYLAERAGQVISAEQLLIDIWRGTFYGDNPVHKCVALLRRGLGDNAQRPSYIQTLRKRGYRLIATVSMPDDYVAGAPQVAARPWRGESPYVGLRAFSEAEFGLYFGRTRALAGLLAAVREQWRNQRNLVMVVGPSGSGKSSLLRAGFIPKLSNRHGLDGLRVARHSWVDLSRDCYSCDDLGSALDDLVAQDSEVPSADSAVDPHPSAATVIDHALILDHAEALVQSSVPVAQRSALDRRLAQWAERSDLMVFLLARSDAYTQLLDALPSLAELKAGAGHYDLPPVGRGEIAEMIRGPARLAALRFEYDPSTRVRLDDALLDAAAAHPSSLPLLQYTLQQLYDRRSADGVLKVSAYTEMGGLVGAIAGRAEAVFLGLGEPVQSALPAVLAKLVRIEASGDLLSGRSVDRAQFQSEAQSSLVDALVDARLLIANQWRGQATVELAHDALLREWPRASAWAQDNQRLLQARHRLGLAADRWRQADAPSDLLLPGGQPLREAQAVCTELPDSLRAHESEFVRLSTRRQRAHRRWRWAGVGALLASVLVSVLMAYTAHRAMTIAERQQRDGEVLVDFLLDDLSDKLRTIGRLDLLGAVTAEVTRYLDQASAPADPTQRLRRARALRNLGEVDVGQGQSGTAAVAIDSALKLLRGMPAPDQEHADYYLELGTVLYWQGYLALQAGRNEEARTAWEGYRDAAQRMLQREPEALTAQLELSYALNNLGSLALRERRLDEAAAQIEQSIAIKQALLRRAPERVDIAAELADSISWMGSIRERQGRLGEANERYEAQRALLQQLAEQAPLDLLWRYRLSTATTHLGRLQLALGRTDSAWKMLSVSVRSLETLVDTDPSNRLWQHDLAFAYLQLGWLAHLRGRNEPALAAFDRAEALLNGLPVGTVAGEGVALLKLQLRLRRLLCSVDQLGQSERERQSAAVVLGLRNLSARRPDGDIEHRLSLALALYVQARLSSQPEQAKAALQQAKDRIADLADASTDKRVLALWSLFHAPDDPLTVTAREQLQRMGYQHPELTRLRIL